MRRRMLPLGAGLVLLSTWAAPLQAQVPPQVRLRLVLERSTRSLELGEAFVVSVEVWVSTWFRAAVEFPPTLAAAGALVEVVGGSPESRFEDHAGRRWTGLVRRYRVLSAQPGELTVALAAPLAVQPGGTTRSLTPALPPPLRLSVRLPAGAEDLQPFVAARRLELRQRWEPGDTVTGVAVMQVGDLVRRELLLDTDSSSVLLPEPDFAAPPGVAVRVRPAQNQEQRAHAAAAPTLTRRVEAVYTLQRAGAVALPAIELVWWDLARRERRVARVPGRSFIVQAAAVAVDPFAVAAPVAAPVSAAWRVDWRVAGLLGGAAVTAGLLWMRDRVGAATGGEAAAQSPARAWRRLRLACLRNDAAAADAAVQASLALLGSDVRQRWLRDAELVAALHELGRVRFGPAGVPGAAVGWHGRTLWQVLLRLRRDAPDAGPAPTLPTLHP